MVDKRQETKQYFKISLFSWLHVNILISWGHSILFISFRLLFFLLYRFFINEFQAPLSLGSSNNSRLLWLCHLESIKRFFQQVNVESFRLPVFWPEHNWRKLGVNDYSLYYSVKCRLFLSSTVEIIFFLKQPFNHPCTIDP